MSPAVANVARAIEQMHGCKVSHVEGMPVIEMFGEQVVWEGVVHVFDVTGHPKAKRAYGWSYGHSGEFQYVGILGLPPVTNPRTAVQAYIASLGRK